MSGDKLDIHVFSDSFGKTGEQLIRCALSQFGLKDSEVKKHPHIEDISRVKRIIEDLNISEGTIFICTIVNLEVLKELKRFSTSNEIKIIDLLSSLVNVLEEKLKKPPIRESGIYRKMDEEYFKRIEAIEFAVKYDDGKDTSALEKADIILIGVSRTSKTPLSIYLGNNHHIKVLNIPIVPEIGVPEELYKVSRRKIVGLTNTVESLNRIRNERVKSIGSKKNLSYSSLGRIIEELEYAEGIMKKIGCPIIDVSKRAIEETSQIIIDIIK